jgi:hypothetical protein
MAFFIFVKRKSLKENSPILPAIAIRSVATGLFMMTFFTGLWASIAYGGLYRSAFRVIIFFFIILMFIFIMQGIKFLRISKKYPAVQSPEDAAEGKKMGMWFGIIFGAEGLFIFLAINLVNNLGHPDLIIPAIALVVGMHFYPMAWIFKRTIDYYLATWATFIAMCGIVFTLYKTLPPDNIISFVGIGLAIATTCYGLYMIYYGKRMIKANPFSGVA